jgi:hypothetical protein
MPTNFPTSVDNFTNPTANDSLNLPSHSTQHANANDAIEAVEDYLLNGGQGLTLVKKQAIGTAVSSVTVTGAFSSTYENYMVMVTGGLGSQAANLALTLGSTNTGYYNSGLYVPYNSATVFALASSNTSGWPNAVSITTSTMMGQFTLLQPNLAKITGVDIVGIETYSTGISLMRRGYVDNTTQYTALTLTTSGGTITGGTVYVYGYGIGQ